MCTKGLGQTTKPKQDQNRKLHAGLPQVYGTDRIEEPTIAVHRKQCEIPQISKPQIHVHLTPHAPTTSKACIWVNTPRNN